MSLTLCSNAFQLWTLIVFKTLQFDFYSIIGNHVWCSGVVVLAAICHPATNRTCCPSESVKMQKVLQWMARRINHIIKWTSCGKSLRYLEVTFPKKSSLSQITEQITCSLCRENNIYTRLAKQQPQWFSIYSRRNKHFSCDILSLRD